MRACLLNDMFWLINQKGVKKMNEDFQIVKSCLMIRMPKELDHHQAKRIRETADRYIESKDISNDISRRKIYGLTEND